MLEYTKVLPYEYLVNHLTTVANGPSSETSVVTSLGRHVSTLF